MSDGNDRLKVWLGGEHFLFFYVQNKTSTSTLANFLDTLYDYRYDYRYDQIRQ